MYQDEMDYPSNPFDQVEMMNEENVERDESRPEVKKLPKGMAVHDQPHFTKNRVFSPKTLVMGGLLGLLAGLAVSAVSQIGKVSVKETLVMPFPTKNLNKRGQILVSLYSYFMKDAWEICPDEFKDDYVHLVAESMKHAEIVLGIEDELSTGARPPSIQMSKIAVNHGIVCYQKISDSLRFFEAQTFRDMNHKKIEAIHIELGGHVQNISNMCDIN